MTGTSRTPPVLNQEQQRGMPEPAADARTNSLADASGFCPNCSAQLVDYQCKLKCPRCGYHLSCSDFY